MEHAVCRFFFMTVVVKHIEFMHNRFLCCYFWAERETHMPAIVDHEERRNDVASIAAGLVAEIGAEAVTFRDVAKAAGYSTSVVSHYFRNKQDLLYFMFEQAAKRGAERLRHAVECGADLEECTMAILPTDEERRRDWHVVLAFWGKAFNDVPFQEAQQTRNREMLALIQKLLMAEYTSKEAEIRARTMLTVIVGLATQALFDPKFWTPQKQRAVIRRVLGNEDT